MKQVLGLVDLIHHLALFLVVSLAVRRPQSFLFLPLHRLHLNLNHLTQVFNGFFFAFIIPGNDG